MAVLGVSEIQSVKKWCLWEEAIMDFSESSYGKAYNKSWITSIARGIDFGFLVPNIVA